MKRFRWSLQRLLDVRRQREQALRSELLRLSQEMARTRQEIVHHRRIIRSSLKELAQRPLDERIPRQETVMACSAGGQKEIDRLVGRLRALESQRKETIARLIKTKGSRESLERMREEARQLHMREQLKLEQKELDEGAQVSFVRRARPRPAAGTSTGD